MFPVEDTSHLVSFDGKHGRRYNGRGRPQTDFLPRQTTFAEKASRSQHPHNTLSTFLVCHGEPHTTFLDVHHMVKGVPLCEDGLVFLKFHDLSGRTG